MINDHFELFLTCAEMKKADIKKLLAAAQRQELEAVGIYITEAGKRVAEVEFMVDWEKHKEMIGVHGEYFDTSLAGWKDGLAPEAYVAAQRLVAIAKEQKKQVFSWIRVMPEIRQDKVKHDSVCKNLGYYGGGPVPAWKKEPAELSRNINYLDEAKVIQRYVP